MESSQTLSGTVTLRPPRSFPCDEAEITQPATPDLPRLRHAAHDAPQGEVMLIVSLAQGLPKGRSLSRMPKVFAGCHQGKLCRDRRVIIDVEQNAGMKGGPGRCRSLVS